MVKVEGKTRTWTPTSDPVTGNRRIVIAADLSERMLPSSREEEWYWEEVGAVLRKLCPCQHRATLRQSLGRSVARDAGMAGLYVYEIRVGSNKQSAAFVGRMGVAPRFCPARSVRTTTGSNVSQQRIGAAHPLEIAAGNTRPIVQLCCSPVSAESQSGTVYPSPAPSRPGSNPCGPE
jgi:hypothetical protein